MLPEFDLTGKVIAVSGGSRGIGLSFVGALVESGAKVYSLDVIPPIDKFKALQEKAETIYKTTLIPLALDVTKEADVIEAFNQIGEKEGRLDGCIACAGVCQEVSALDTSQAEWEKIHAVNAAGVFVTAREAAKQMIRFGNGGSILLVASMSYRTALLGFPAAAYGASKGAVKTMAQHLASEWGRHGIRVNSISPGYTRTEMIFELFKYCPERQDVWAAQNMLGRCADTEEYRGPAVFMMSKASSFMTGSDLLIDGGHCAW